MIRVFAFSLFTTISLFAKEELMVDNSMPWMMGWLVASLFTVGLMFWSIYKAMRTKNPKYGWGMGLSIILMIVLLFI